MIGAKDSRGKVKSRSAGFRVQGFPHSVQIWIIGDVERPF